MITATHRDAAGYNSGFLFANQGTDAMDFQFTDEQLMIQAVARRIAQEKIAPTAADIDRSGEFPLENIRSEEHTSALQSLMSNSYAVLRLKNKKQHKINTT